MILGNLRGRHEEAQFSFSQNKPGKDFFHAGTEDCKCSTFPVFKMQEVVASRQIY